MKTLNTMVKALCLMMLIMFVGLIHASTSSAESTTIGVNPSIAVFKQLPVNSGSSTTGVSVKNKGLADLQINSINISGEHASQFQVTTDNCSGYMLSGNTDCSILVSFIPTERGYKQALLDVYSDSPDTPVLQAFLTNREDSTTQSARRLPPVLFALNVPEQMYSDQTYTLEWSVLGYHDEYLSSIVMFNCNGVPADTCGANYGDEGRFFSKVGVLSEKVKSSWKNGSVYAYEHKYSVQFTPSFTEETDIVVRFYRLNSDDKAAGGGGLSLIIPGNLSEFYYDKQGRRIKKKIIP